MPASLGAKVTVKPQQVLEWRFRQAAPTHPRYIKAAQTPLAYRV